MADRKLKIRALWLLVVIIPLSLSALGKDFYVAPDGSDRNTGTAVQPFASVERALLEARKYKKEKVNVILRGGTYYLSHPITFSAEDSRVEGAGLVLRNQEKEVPLIKGSRKADLKWKLVKDLYEANVGDQSLLFDELYLNGELLHMARYPNYRKERLPFGGAAADAIDPSRVQRWKNPEGAFLHAMQSSMWGGFSFLVTGKKDFSTLLMEGGWQNNRPSAMHKQYRFVEHVFEELDTLNEWYFDKKQRKLFLKTTVNPNSALVETSQLESLIRFSGDRGTVKNITISGLTLCHTLRTFMKNKEPLLRSDWTIYREGAISLENTENIRITHCTMRDLGGNALVYSCYNKNDQLLSNHIFNVGSSAVVFVGNPEAVRSPSYQYSEFVPFEKLDTLKGPLGNDYPQMCLVQDNLIHDIGRVEKQVAGMQISMSSAITVSHNSIYDVPRAGININEGTWGGHEISFNDVFNTVRETGDHGAFNSWGRDRFWHPVRAVMDTLVAKHPNLIFLDATKPTRIFNNRFRCDNGWDIDLDDGSSNYIIENNICLSGGLKLREGFRRKVRNNILINNSFHPHVWFENSGDVFQHNIVSAAYLPIRVKDWGNQIDSNFFMDEAALQKTRQWNIDKNSISGDPMFLDAAKGDFQVAPGSAAGRAGFENFAMDFGVSSPELRALAKKAPIPALLPRIWNEDATYDFLGAKVKNLSSLAERSATGMPSETGVLVIDLSDNSLLSGSLKPNDVLLEMEGQALRNIKDLIDARRNSQSRKTAKMIIFRDQKENSITVNLK